MLSLSPEFIENSHVYTCHLIQQPTVLGQESVIPVLQMETFELKEVQGLFRSNALTSGKVRMPRKVGKMCQFLCLS